MTATGGPGSEGLASSPVSCGLFVVLVVLVVLVVVVVEVVVEVLMFGGRLTSIVLDMAKFCSSTAGSPGWLEPEARLDWVLPVASAGSLAVVVVAATSRRVVALEASSAALTVGIGRLVELVGRAASGGADVSGWPAGRPRVVGGTGGA